MVLFLGFPSSNSLSLVAGLVYGIDPEIGFLSNSLSLFPLLSSETENRAPTWSQPDSDERLTLSSSGLLKGIKKNQTWSIWTCFRPYSIWWMKVSRYRFQLHSHFRNRSLIPIQERRSDTSNELRTERPNSSATAPSSIILWASFVVKMRVLISSSFRTCDSEASFLRTPTLGFQSLLEIQILASYFPGLKPVELHTMLLFRFPYLDLFLKSKLRLRDLTVLSSLSYFTPLKLNYLILPQK